MPRRLILLQFRGLQWEGRKASLLRNPSGRHECPVRMLAVMVLSTRPGRKFRTQRDSEVPTLT